MAETEKRVGLSLTVNGQEIQLDASAADTPLLWALRDIIGLTGTKFGCGVGLCGACSVLMGDKRFFSCMAPVRAFVGQPITTIEGLRADPLGKRLQDAWVEADVVQCGYCQPGQLIAAAALLKANPTPDDAAIEAGMSGNLCRCGTYPRIREAVKLASKAKRA
jgi:isoquinoline 1-oxidoreductase alpha subunit